MKQFAELFLALDRTNSTNEKTALLKTYFINAAPEDKIWALALFTGRRPKRAVNSTRIQEWAAEQSGIPFWLFRECYGSVGDLAETIALVLPVSAGTTEKTLNEWFIYIQQLNDASEDIKKELIINAWGQLTPYEIFVFNKLLMGSFRIGVSATLVIRSIAEATDTLPEVIAHRVMGNWNPNDTLYEELIHADYNEIPPSTPYPFYLAYALETQLEDLGNTDDWQVEWKWDGIRAQAVKRNDELYIWSRGEELVTDKFPELQVFRSLLPNGTVIDGEILCYAGERPLPFNILQTRIGRKNITKKILTEAPVALIAYDLLEENGDDVRTIPLSERRQRLEYIYKLMPANPILRLSPVVQFNEWGQLKLLHAQSRSMAAEGFMLKRRDSPYLTGRKKGDWWKWKIDPLSVDAVLIYAQKGHGRRAELFTDYTFAVWNENGQLVPFAKAYSGLTDAEIREVDRFVRQHTVEKFGPVRTVKAELVFEIGFEGINASARHKSGIAVRFPRILRWRKDKKPRDADSTELLRKLLEQY